MRKVKDPDLWQLFYEKVLPLLDDLQPACETVASSRKLRPALKTAVAHWTHQISDVRDQARRSHQTIIGVLGNTGDGKSSTINALLDEESLLPTNCMRACTAVATEVSYNHDEDEESPYRAEVEFISREEWVKEVNTLLMDLLAEETTDKDDLDPDSDAAKALAKIQAVYPLMTHEDLTSSTSAQLSTHPNVNQLLGTTMTLKCDNALEIREQVEPYIDSNDKDDDTAAYWPLVKIVRIFTKARVLANGLTIVDLPGHQDWDAARAAVASEYIKSCSGVWVVAPINRAVDNKTAKDIISNSIKRQLKLDGSFSALTVICSKTDEMTISSGIESMKSKLDKDTNTIWKQTQALGRRIIALEKELMVVRGRRKTSRASTSSVDADRTAKRARTEPPVKQAEKVVFNKPTRATNDYVVDSDPMAQKHEELAELRQKKRELMDEVHARLIRKRNKLCRDAVRKHLDKGFKDLDRQVSSNSDGFGQADEKSRDYDEMSALTPVFCTSSLVYQRMQGLVANKDDETPGFDNEEDTEIPQLQAHAQKLTENLRIAKYQEILNSICQILNPIAIWAQDTAETTATIDGERLRGMLVRFNTDLNGEVEDCRDKLHMAVETVLYEEMKHLSSAASRAAVPTAISWGNMNFFTLKATFRRRGTWRSNNFNEDLLRPITDNLTETWANFFQFSIPGVLDNFSVSATRRLGAFHEDVMKQLGIHDFDHDETPTIVQLNRQLELHKLKVVRLAAHSRMGVDDAQKDANRALTTIIAEVMAPGYEECGLMRGKGSAKKIQAKIEEYVLNRKVKMFRDAIRNVKDVLEEGLKMVGEDMAADIKNIGFTMYGDYILALAEKQESARRLEEASKREMLEFLEHAAEQFK
ncbi:Dynamin family-domain-containing protein [Colletotrichum godetiae]|uniref:Dynamin family-domain-containing protein n=1 Tax=Colletotrichum godetiae TaxID=1209918 RepID=A0AAJ0AS91_9PEZI|nr:Dynamin family-domain-containing protein [Colletotrichum godetiae]KAK1676846.1 Dynamin family-domain-containing protein [Colletotrichum godetiae]